MASFPSHMNNVDIVISPLDKVVTDVDDDFRDASIKRRGANITLRGQANIYSGDSASDPRTRPRSRVNAIGDTGAFLGHLTFKRAYLSSISIVLKDGDLVKEIAGISFNMKIIQLRPIAPLNGSFLLLQAYIGINTDDRQVL